MDPSAITALSALLGATIGGLTSLMASLLSQRTQVRAQWLTQQLLRRQDLYKEFIEDASKCYIHALQHDEPDIGGLVSLYGKLGRMHILSAPNVIETAGVIERKIIDTYFAPDKTFMELREMVHSGSVNLFDEFSAACRAEFESIRGHRF